MFGLSLSDFFWGKGARHAQALVLLFRVLGCRVNTSELDMCLMQSCTVFPLLFAVFSGVCANELSEFVYSVRNMRNNAYYRLLSFFVLPFS